MSEPWEEIQDRITLEESSYMRLGDLILDIYPGLQSGIEEITQQLELAANDPEEFKRQFNQQVGDSRRWFARFTPQAATLVTIVGLALASCSTPISSVEPVRPTVTLQQLVETSTPTSTSTSVPTETPEPTPTHTVEPTATPIIEGNLDPFLDERNAEAGIVKDILIIQNIINTYNPESDLGFGEYISTIKGSFKNNAEKAHIYRLLEDLERYDKINTLILARVMQKNLPALGIIDTGVWSENRVADILPANAINLMVILEERENEPEFMGGFYVYEGFGPDIGRPRGFIGIGDIPVRVGLLGDLTFNSENYDPLELASDFTLFITVAILEGPTGREDNAIALLVTTIDEKGKMVLIEVNEGNIDEHFGSGVIIQMGGIHWIERYERMGEDFN